MDKFYGVYNTSTEQFVIPMNGFTLMDKESAKAMATELNQAMKPEYQHYTVVTVTFDKEI